MANYLPVLLVSVAANSIPDDSSLSTLPRGQVDYLSHDWEEEDVWRSWRNMTRQKNEITNGVRLENASWRTWWKQRNGLGTVTPETLNWLKDSDVTWLYGPLHTAVDWTPPPKPIPDTATRTSALDLSTTHKPILKHRSISQLLTSDLPTSPVFTPTESEDDETLDQPSPLEDSGSDQRPSLTHTKSDTHITRWGASRAFRKDSPPRIDPPAGSSGVASSGEGGYSSTHLHALSTGSIPSSDSFPPIPLSNQIGQPKKRHISFNTFVEQCIAIEKPKKSSLDEDNGDDDSSDLSVTTQQDPYSSRTAWGYDDGYEEDEEGDSNDEDEPLSMWDERFGGSALAGSDSDSYDEAAVEDGEFDDVIDDDLIPIRSSIRNRPRATHRSQSSASSSSASTSTSTDTSPSYQPPSRRNRSPSSASSQRRFSSSTARPHVRLPPSCPSTPRRRRRAPPLIRTTTPTSNSDQHSHTSPPPIQPTHVTIAPIAPTILKTGGYAYGESEWVEGFGDEGGSDDGIIGGGRWWGAGAGAGVGAGEKGKDSLRESVRDSSGEDEGTPVELVYVPPLGSNYSMGGRERPFERQRKRNGVMEVMEDHEDGLGHGEPDVYRRRRRMFSVGVAGDDDVDEGDVDVAPGGRTPSPRTSPLPVPTVVVDPDADGADGRNGSVRGRDAYDYFGGPDLGEDFPARRRNLSGRGRRGSDGDRGRPAFSSVGPASSLVGEVERSWSTSKSRTPSPAIISSSDSPGSATAQGAAVSGSSESVPAPIPSTPVPVRRSASASPPHTQALLSPPPRGRGSSSHQDLQVHTRGRSSTRTSSVFHRDGVRDRSSIGSPLGSYSPDGIGLVSAGGAYAGGRIEREREKRVVGDRDRGRDKDREQSRGRDRTGKRLSHSLSPDDPPVVASPPVALLVTQDTLQANLVSLSDEASSIPRPAADDRKAEERQRNLTPTPSNSPVVSMQSVPAAFAAAANKPTSPKGRSPPLAVPAPHPAEPSTSFSISPPREHLAPSPPLSPIGPRSPRSPTRGDSTIVGKAVEIVSSAGAFFGLWHHGETDSGAS